MSAALVGKVLENPEWFESRGEMLVMILLADSASSMNGFSCWYGVDTIAVRSKMTARGVQKILRALEERGLVVTRRQGSRNGTNLYEVNLSRRGELSSGRTEFGGELGFTQSISNTVGSNNSEDKKSLNGSSKKNNLGTTNGEAEEGFRFEEFWEIYEKKVGKTETLKVWKSLSEKEKIKIRDHVKKYVGVTTKKKGEGKRVRRDPVRYLRTKMWEDEELPEVWGGDEKSNGAKKGFAWKCEDCGTGSNVTEGSVIVDGARICQACKGKRLDRNPKSSGKSVAEILGKSAAEFLK